MRKQELVHLHALCALVRDRVESRADVPAGAFARYDDLQVSPAAIYRDKRAHRRAVECLGADVAAALDESTTDRPLGNAGETDGDHADAGQADVVPADAQQPDATAQDTAHTDDADGSP